MLFTHHKKIAATFFLFFFLLLCRFSSCCHSLNRCLHLYPVIIFSPPFKTPKIKIIKYTEKTFQRKKTAKYKSIWILNIRFLCSNKQTTHTTKKKQSLKKKKKLFHVYSISVLFCWQSTLFENTLFLLSKIHKIPPNVFFYNRNPSCKAFPSPSIKVLFPFEHEKNK